jgi:hypothetical protein
MNRPGPVTLSQVKRALQELGGESTWNKIFDQVTKNRNGDYSHYKTWRIYKTTTNQIIQQHCPGYEKYNGYPHFEKVGPGRCRLIGQTKTKTTPIALDIGQPSQPERIKQETYRILRDTALAREVKESNKYQCHICGQILKLSDERPYAEAHHIKPLGSPHDGPDVRENILCVCPNHHVLLDYGAIKLAGAQLTGIAGEYIEYHNKNIFGKR